jgi:hypothetical protein
MAWCSDLRTLGAAVFRLLPFGLAAACAVTLAACNQNGQSGLFASQPRGATVAFESIDGPPPGQFQKLVQNLNDEAQSRRLAVISRESPSVYRVRGTIAAKTAKGQTTISWAWDVFDAEQRRVLRINGQETAKSRSLGGQRNVWNVVDDAMLQRIARSGMDQLAAFLTSPQGAPEVAPEVADFTTDLPGQPQIGLIGQRDSSPESAGIFRIFRANADPIPSVEAPSEADESTGSVPLPRRRPAPDAAVTARETVTLAAASH